MCIRDRDRLRQLAEVVRNTAGEVCACRLVTWRVKRHGRAVHFATTDVVAMTEDEVVAAFAAYLEATRGMSEHSVRAYCGDVRHCAGFARRRGTAWRARRSGARRRSRRARSVPTSHVLLRGMPRTRPRPRPRSWPRHRSWQSALLLSLIHISEP